jgi:cytidylate kinase
LVATTKRLDLNNEDKIVSVASKLDVSFVGKGEETKVYHDGLDCTLAIRTEECGIVASRLAVFPAVRKVLLSKQHAFRLRPGLVADGRDMGTVVFPDADLQIFMTASVEERARRRYNQLKEKEICASLADLSRDIKERDERDVRREESPLKPSPTAVFLDTTAMSIEEVTGKVKILVRKRGLT